MIVVIMGVSGSGKSTIGSLLAERLGCPFLDADEFHPAGNVAKMAAGTPLTDADRWPWLETLNRKLKEQRDAVLACSALKESYRQVLLQGVANGCLVHLHGGKELIQSRMRRRQHRYMPASLLDSQFATLEEPAQAIVIDILQSPERCVEDIIAALPSRLL